MIFNRLAKSDSARILTSQQLADYLWGGRTVASGVTVTPSTAMTYSTVFACVRVIAESMGQLPLHLMERAGTQRRKATEHALYRLLHDDGPNEFQTPQEYLEWVGACLALRGNAYSYITRVRGEVRELLPISPGSVAPRLLSDGGTVVYDITFRQGFRTVDASEIFHVKLFSLDGYTGASPVAWQRETIGVGLAAQEHGGRLFSNSARPGGILSTDKALSKEASKRLIADVEDIVGGLENAGRTLVLGDGMKWQQIGMSSEDAQWLEGRKFTRSEIAGIFRVPPHKIGDLERATFSNIEHQGLEFTTDCMMPYLTKFEGRARKQLLAEDERARLYFKFNVDGLLRGDSKSRGEFYTSMVQNGAMSPNEIRELEDMNPREGGDVYLTPANMLIDGKPPPKQDGGAAA